MRASTRTEHVRPRAEAEAFGDVSVGVVAAVVEAVRAEAAATARLAARERAAAVEVEERRATARAREREDLLDLVDGRSTGEDGLRDEDLAEDAAEAPHVDAKPVSRACEKDLGRAVPERWRWVVVGGMKGWRMEV